MIAKENISEPHPQHSASPPRRQVRPNAIVRTISESVRYRALVSALVVRHLAGRYRGSVLGFIWSLLNPLCLMAVYTLVFHVYSRFDDANHYTLFVFCGLLPWIWTQSTLVEGTSSIAGSGHLVTKSMFPPHILPLVSVFTGLSHFLLSLPIFFLFSYLLGGEISWSILLLPFVVTIHFFLLYGFVLASSALNVFYRDVQHLIGNILSLIFFLCPIVYPATQVPARYSWTLSVNPFAAIVQLYHAILLRGELPSAILLEASLGWAIVSLVVGAVIFQRYRDHLAEAL
jgi:ABC-type polysaccharide/polyol phosphate export permease